MQAHRQSPALATSFAHPEPRPLPSAGVTRFPRYYGPLRRPLLPDLSLTGCRLSSPAHNRGFPVLRLMSPSVHAAATTPAEPSGVVGSLPRGRRPSLNLRQVGFRIALFEAYSAFTHVAACTFAKSPARPSTPKASSFSLPPTTLRLLPAGATSCRVGFAPTEHERLCTAH